MSLDLKAMAMAISLLWGGLIFLVGLGGMALDGYGQALLEVPASIYPGYTASGGFPDLLVGTLYGLADGAIGGFLLAWLYNRLTRRRNA